MFFRKRMMYPLKAIEIIKTGIGQTKVCPIFKFRYENNFHAV